LNIYGAKYFRVMSLNRYIGGPVQDPRLKKVYLIDPFDKFICNYSCRYCVLGRPLTDKCPISRYRFNMLIKGAKYYVEKYGVRGVNAFLISPYGEPTLLPELPQLLRTLKTFNKPVAIYTNSSGILDDKIYNLLLNFDIILFKLDTLYKDTLHSLNRPSDEIDPDEILSRLVRFRRDFPNKMYVETMFVRGYNDSFEEAMELISAIKRINPNKYFISMPYLPPGGDIRLPSRDTIDFVYRELSQYMPNRVFILDKPVEAPLNRKVDDPVEELLYIASLYPIRLEEAYRYLGSFGMDGEVTVKELLDLGDIEVRVWMGEEYIVSMTLSRMIKN